VNPKEHPMGYFKALGIAAVALAAAAVLAISASAGSSAGAVVKVGSSNLGRILVDAKGKTLYMWAHDKSAKSTCNGDCAAYWPPLVTHGRPLAGAGAHANLLGASRRSDGRMQVTYAGHPLYYFVQDARAGQTKGEGLTGFGGRWDPVSANGSAVRKGSGMTADAYSSAPLKATVIAPTPGASAGSGGTFSVDLSLEARNRQANNLLSRYRTAFNDPSKPTFHPGPNAAAPGLVVLLSTTPSIAGTPLQGPNTNLAGVFQVNDVLTASGLRHTFHSWVVTSPGFFGKNVRATLTVYAVNGNAPAVVTGSEKPISNTVRETFTIAG
jgi:predicted lipoprotein with Yx(FWY)xxD motif